MTLNDLFQRAAKGFNAIVMAAMNVPAIDKYLRRSLTTITYIGRRSGRTITLPVGYRRSGDTVTIVVAMPDRKKWWRNFLGDGAPMTIQLDEKRSGHAVAHREGRGRAQVVLQLDPA